ncbi:MAG: tRNA (adenosine(37)-N6)-threonylcarbamoyltransferase complex ATPase subunit type 1 TsaE, partial [Clostridia bacterium]|nr:tRNA (adenosine(37)-N6)-threonylcarbamoyltransferase complex ATPase subunit type 1 TsaE [Clostridia bacterium]
EETEQIGAEFAKILKPSDFVAMFGDLGAGKTAFVRGAVSLLAPGSFVQSPTYTIVNEYPSEVPVYHFDMYRIDDEDSLYSIGYYDYLENGGICFAEWCEKIKPYLPERFYTVTIRKSAEDPEKRIIRICESTADGIENLI